METLESRLVGSLAELLAYARRKVGDPDLAADVVQESLLKALQAAEALRDQERLFAWFYRILDNTTLAKHPTGAPSWRWPTMREKRSERS